LRLYVTSWKIAGSVPDEAIEFLKFTLFFKLHNGPGVDSSSNINEYQESSFWGVALLACKADNLIGLHSMLKKMLCFSVYM
jgi:hypothetical protein